MQGVEELMGLGGREGLLDLARRCWPTWASADQRLAVVNGFDEFLEWRRTAPREQVDGALFALAKLSSTDGGDDPAAGAALAKCLLPGAIRLACSLSRGEGVSERELRNLLVASQLWIEVRSFPWQRRRNVAANILVGTRVAVMRELGVRAYVDRIDPTWARTQPGLGTEAIAHLDGVADEPATPTTAEQELLEVLQWAHDHEVISTEDRHLLLTLVEAASEEPARNSGCGGLASSRLAAKVAPRLGCSEGTVRRRAARSVHAMAEAFQGRLHVA